jgi:uncharacterized membrane protein
VQAMLMPEEFEMLQDLRQKKPARNPPPKRMSAGDRIADKVAATVGSWRFIIIQSCLLVMWIIINVTAWIKHWDPYPFILLNLMLSFQAAYTAPIIMMSQNRQSIVDRQSAEHDYQVNVKAELEIELLHDRIERLHDQINTLRQQEIVEISQMLKQQQQCLLGMEEILLKHLDNS